MREKNELGKLLPRRREAAAIIGWILALTAFLTLALLITLNLIPRAVQLRSLERMGADFVVMRGKITQALAQKNSLEKEAAESNPKISKTDGADGYLSFLLGLAKDSGLEVEKIEEDGQASQKDLEGKIVNIKFSSQFSGLQAFIRKLENSPVPIAVRSLSVSTADGVSTDLSCQIGIAFFSYERFSKQP
jgi:hypothetical protein